MTNATTKKATLLIETKSGSYFHRITFEPMGDQVKVTEVMRDELLGNWMCGNGESRMVPIAEARTFYRERKKFGYKAN